MHHEIHRGLIVAAGLLLGTGLGGFGDGSITGVVKPAYRGAIRPARHKPL